ncbi:MAG: flavodoxin family protein [Leptospirales bacterium]|nr:flavodoxin family protein [Leptospirales bacterium]
MKALAINGSPRKEGNTAFALQQIGSSLKEEGIDFEMAHIGHKAIHGCIDCGKCARNADDKCASFDDEVNEILPLMRDADVLLLGAPVYYSGIAGTMKCFLDRSFFVAGVNKGRFRHKIGASVVAVRRSGGMTSFNTLNHYFLISEMIVAGSSYWNVIHGRKPGEAAQDLEGIHTMRTLGKNIAWLLKMKNSANQDEPQAEAKIYTNFIR